MEPLLPSWTVNLEGLSALVWHTFSIRLTYNSGQNYTKPITMRMVVKNQSHVSWRSIPRHFIRSLRVKFYAPFKQREFIDHVGSEEKHTVLTQIWNAEEHLSLIVLLYTLYHLKCPIVYNSRFNRVTSYTWKPVRLQYNTKSLHLIQFSSSASTAFFFFFFLHLLFPRERRGKDKSFG